MGLIVTLIITVVLLIGAAFGLGLLVYGYDRGKMAYRILSTSTSPAADLSEGYVEVKGALDRAAEGYLTSPFGQRECVIAAWEVEEWDESGDHSNWTTEADGGQAVPFYVRDDSGEVLVDFGGEVAGAADDEFATDGGVDADENPTSAGVQETAGPVYDTSDEDEVRWAVAGREETIEVGVSDDDPVPGHIEEFVRSHDSVSEQTGSITNIVDVGNAHGDRKYTENRLSEGDDLYVLGHYDRGRDAITLSEEGPMLISDKSEWKLVGWRTIVSALSILGGIVLLVLVLFFGSIFLL